MTAQSGYSASLGQSCNRQQRNHFWRFFQANRLCWPPPGPTCHPRFVQPAQVRGQSPGPGSGTSAALAVVVRWPCAAATHGGFCPLCPGFDRFARRIEQPEAGANSAKEVPLGEFPAECVRDFRSLLAGNLIMSQRFFVENLIQGDVAQLDSTEAQHALKVMRCRVGDQVILFDNSGDEFPARISRIDRSSVQLDVLERRAADRELACSVTIGVALPKGDRQRWLVEKTVELGVAQLVPLVTERGVAQPHDKALERLRRTVVEASKQCGRNRLMRIAEPMPVTDFCASVSATSLKLLATPGGRPWSHTLGDATEVATCVGPEGGFTENELQCALAGQWTPISLGRRILRIETAAVAIASAVAVMTES